jgi:hypothetical protein
MTRRFEDANAQFVESLQNFKKTGRRAGMKPATGWSYFFDTA